MWSNNSELVSEVIAVCNDLGHKSKHSDNRYVLNRKDCHHVLKDLIRFLRNDDKSTFGVRSQLGSTNIVDNDLIPIVEQYCLEDIPLFDKILRLLLDLTNPVILLFQQKIPTDMRQSQKYLEFQSHLYSYKLSFGSHRRFWSVLAKHLTRIVDLDDENRQIEDSLMFERILILIRNVLHIPIDMSANRMIGEEYTNPHDRVIEVLHSSGITELIVYLCGDDIHREFCFHLIEIISLLFREQNAEFIAKSVANCPLNGANNGDRRSDYEREIDRKELQELKARDMSLSLSKAVPNLNRFSGTYLVKNMKSISDRDMVCHKTPQDLSQLNFDTNKDIKRKLRSKKPMTDSVTNKSSLGPQVIHKSTLKVRQILFDFCTEFVTNCFNEFMRLIYDNLARNLSQDNDETYYLWAIQFFMEFNRTNPKTMDKKLVSETLSTKTFLYLHSRVDNYMEIIKTQKQEINLWSKRLHYAMKAYREMLFSVNSFYFSKESDIRYMAKDAMKVIFYEVEYRDQLLGLLHEYNESKMTKTFLKDLIETNHIFVKMLENYYKNNSRLLVREKVRRIKKKSTQKKATKEKVAPEDVWNEIISTVSEALSGSLELPSPDEDISVRALDATSEKSLDEQKMDVLRRVNNFLLEKRVAEAVSLYRDARNCWTGDEDNAFGAPDIAPEDELLSLNEILMTDFPTVDTAADEPNEEEIDEVIEEKERKQQTREREIEFNEVIHKFCHPSVVRNYCFLLKSYDTNSDETNHCILKMLHRIAFDCKMHVMLFQASLFRTFQRILSDPLRDTESVKELKRFAKFIVSKFVLVTKKNDKVFFEILFWKGCSEANQVEEGYHQNVSSKTAKLLWTEEQELELKVLFEEYKDKGTADKDYIDLIVDHMIDDTKTRRQVIKELKRQGIFIKIKKKYIKKRAKYGDFNENNDFNENENSDYEEVVGDYENSDKSEDEDTIHKTNEVSNRDKEDIENVNESENNEPIESITGETNEDIESEDENHKKNKGNETKDNDKNKGKSGSISDSSDDEDNVLHIDEDIEENTKSPKHIESSDSSDESIDERIETNKRSFDDSDDEEVVVMSKNKRRNIIIDDSDED